MCGRLPGEGPMGLCQHWCIRRIVQAPTGLGVPVHGLTERGGTPEAIISSDTEILASTELELPVNLLVMPDHI